ncbi:MAG: 4Fe-4S binding protein [Candidatus Diapherotrites archaeon]|nr:4Fe-4S binding protein [Candidatus Diapherotrites archaeon]
MPAINIPEKCLHCGACVGVCPKQAIVLEGEKIKIDKKKCIECKACVLMCPVGAMQIKR